MKKSLIKGGFIVLMAALALTGCFLPDEDPFVVSIAITKQPTKKTYNIDDKLDTTGMEVTAYFEDGTSKVVNDYSTSGFDSASPGEKTVIVTYKDKTAEFKVTVNGGTPTKTLSSIAITTPPSKTTYNVGEDLVLTGLVVTATYSDGTSEAVTVTASNISGYDKNKTGATQTVTVTYQSKTATFTVTVRVAVSANDYNITGSGTAFTATKGTTTVATGAIQAVIDGIRTHANSAAAAIYFGDGTPLDIGTASISFNNTGGTWGAITLSGKITSTSDNYTIYIATTVSVTSNAEIGNTTPSNSAKGDAVRNEGNLTIKAGTVQADQIAVKNGEPTSGTLNIQGGTVKTNWAAIAVRNSNGTVNISGGTISATNAGTVISNILAGVVNITGGTVSGAMGDAVYNTDAAGKINISGGEVKATSGSAVNNHSTGTVNISGGTVSATTGNAIYNDSTGKITVSQAAGATTRITSANVSSSSGTIFLRNVTGATASTELLEIKGGTVENTSTNTNARTIYIGGAGTVNISGGTVSATAGRAVENNGNGVINISGGTVSAGAGRAVNNGFTGAINISGGTVSADTGIAVYIVSTGKVTISGTATISSGNATNTEGTITMDAGNTTAGTRLEINGGTVQNTRYNSNTTSIPGGYAIYNAANNANMVTIFSSAVITGKKYGAP